MEQILPVTKSLRQYYIPAALLTAEMLLSKEWCEYLPAKLFRIYLKSFCFIPCVWCLKTLDTIGNWQRLACTVGVSQHMHKITSLWKFELNRSSKLWDNNTLKKKNPLFYLKISLSLWIFLQEVKQPLKGERNSPQCVQTCSFIFLLSFWACTTSVNLLNFYL